MIKNANHTSYQDNKNKIKYCGEIEVKVLRVPGDISLIRTHRFIL
jgi:hypothetical protein